jgi:hypothetical protein
MIARPTRALALAFVVLMGAGCGRQPALPSELSAAPSVTPTAQATQSAAEVQCPENPPRADVDEVLVFFTCGSRATRPVGPAVRPSDADTLDGRLAAALEALLAGPTEEEQARGLESWFSARTADRLNGVQVDAAGRAIVDFADFSGEIPNASTTAGRMQLLAELRATIFQFDDLESVELWFDGSCNAFWAWLQAPCTPLTRSDD